MAPGGAEVMPEEARPVGAAATMEADRMPQCRFRKKILVWGVLPALVLGALTEPAEAARRRRRKKKQLVTVEELKAAVEPGRLIYDNSLKRRRLALESIVKQTMDWGYKQATVETVAKIFEAPRHAPISVRLDPYHKPFIVDPRAQEAEEIYTTEVPIDIDVGGIEGIQDGSQLGPIEPGTGPIGIDPGTGGPGTDMQGAGQRPPTAPVGVDDERFNEIAQDLENGIHNEILRVTRERGYDLAALNVFAQTLDMVKVILIVATRDLPDEQIRPTLRTVRSLIEQEVLAARYPGVHLAELSSFTLLNERDGHFYEHPVLYWQLAGDQWRPTAGGAISGGGPVEGSVGGSVEVDDYFTSRDFQPEEDFDDRDFLEPLDGF